MGAIAKVFRETESYCLNQKVEVIGNSSNSESTISMMWNINRARSTLRLVSQSLSARLESPRSGNMATMASWLQPPTVDIDNSARSQRCCST